MEICSGRDSLLSFTKNELPNEKIEQLRIIFSGNNNNSSKSYRRPLSLDEAVLLICCALTADRSVSNAVGKIHVLFWKCAQEQISEISADDENIDPMEIIINFMHLISDFHHTLQ